ncbi:hypothetical protein [Nocardioides koreensis]
MSSLTRLRVLLARVVSGSLAPADAQPFTPVQTPPVPAERLCA